MLSITHSNIGDTKSSKYMIHITSKAMKREGLWQPVIGVEADDVTGAVRPVSWEWVFQFAVETLSEISAVTARSL